MTIAEQILPQFIITICEFLAIPLIDNHIIFLSVWSVIHAVVGGILFWFLRKEKHRWLWFFILLIIFELLEFMLSYGANFVLGTPIILEELWQDTTWDIIIGVFAGFLVSVFGASIVRFFVRNIK